MSGSSSSSTATIHKLHGESERLLKTVLSFFIDPCVLRLNLSDLTKVNYTDPSIHLPEEELFIEMTLLLSFFIFVTMRVNRWKDSTKELLSFMKDL